MIKFFQKLFGFTKKPRKKHFIKRTHYHEIKGAIIDTLRNQESLKIQELTDIIFIITEGFYTRKVIERQIYQCYIDKYITRYKKTNPGKYYYTHSVRAFLKNK